MSDKIARGILPALCTPFSDDGTQVAVERVAPLLDYLLDADVDGFFVCGGTGEGAAMSVDERKLMAETVVGHLQGRVPVLLQVGGTATDNAVELARHAASLGVEAVASVAPIERPNDLDAAVAHYAAIGAATDLPFYVYWLSATADKNIDAEQFLNAMDAVPNFTGIKFTDTNLYLFQQLTDLSSARLNAISGPDEMCVAAMVMGSDAAIGSTYNIMPRLFVQMRQAFVTGDIAAAMSAQVQANKVIAALIKVGVLAGLKAILGWRGLPVGPVRPPHQNLSPTQSDQLRSALADFPFSVA